MAVRPGAAIRKAAVAGTFYPAAPERLAEEVTEYLDGIETLEPRLAHPKALVVPHAGYLYSGQVAARAYDELVPARGIVRRVVLIGPSHYVTGRGLAVPEADYFETPLGHVAVDRAAIALLADLPQVVQSAQAHEAEHSLEVQLPFLQRALGEFSLVPIAAGAATREEVAQVLERLWGGPETLIVISSDLSHDHPYDEARRIDGATLARIQACATDLEHREACGATALNGLLSLGRAKGLRVRLLRACNSGDTAGGRDRVVGYAAFALDDGASPAPEDVGRELLGIAKGAIANGLGLSSVPVRRNHLPWLLRPAATYVTLLREGRLRGCMGSLAATRPLGQDVASNARAAAFEDPRFPKLSREEWSRCALEVSLLSAAKPIEFGDEGELLDKLHPGLDGLVIEHEGRRATYLPQVWEELPEKPRFLASLMEKAGLPAGTRLARCRFSRYRVAKFA